MKFAHMWVDTTLATGKVIVLCIHTQQLPFTFHMIIHECCCYRYHHLVVVSQDTSHTSLTVIDGVKLFYQVNATSQTVHQQWQRAWKIFCQASFRWKKMLDWCKKTHFTNYIKLHSSYYYFFATAELHIHTRCLYAIYPFITLINLIIIFLVLVVGCFESAHPKCDVVWSGKKRP